MKKTVLTILLGVALCVVACQKSNDPTANRDPNVATIVVSNVKGDTVSFVVFYASRPELVGLWFDETPATYQIKVNPKRDTVLVGISDQTYRHIGRMENWGLKLEVYYKGELKGTEIFNSIYDADVINSIKLSITNEYMIRCPAWYGDTLGW